MICLIYHHMYTKSSIIGAKKLYDVLLYVVLQKQPEKRKRIKSKELKKGQCHLKCHDYKVLPLFLCTSFSLFFL
jgi:hypothetical protein